MDRGVWPVFGEDFSALGVNFAECDGSHPGPFESEAESADSAEEVEDFKGLIGHR
jgi:hypothetical protein